MPWLELCKAGKFTFIVMSKQGQNNDVNGEFIIYRLNS